MFDVVTFSQADRLRNINLPNHPGVCVALSDYWLQRITENPDEGVELRLLELDQAMPDIVRHQASYGGMRQTYGPVEGRQRLARGVLGIHYDADKTNLIKLDAIREDPFDNFFLVMARDIGMPGTGASWSMRFSHQGKEYGHAIAGYCTLKSLTSNLHEKAYHLFDPNIGEYIANQAGVQDMFRDMLKTCPSYKGTFLIRRLGV